MVNVSIALTETVFAHVFREFIRKRFTDYVKMSSTDKEWRQEAIGFTENYEFPCVDAWDGFQVYVGTKQKSFLQFQKEVFDFKYGSYRLQQTVSSHHG